MPANYADKPSSEWEHSHALATGDIVRHEDGAEWKVTNVLDDGSINVYLISDDQDVTDTWTEEATRVALMDSVLETRDGKSHELATY